MSKKEKNQELIFGIHPIVELLKAKKRTLFTIYTTKPVPKAWNNIAPLLPKATQIQYVSRDVLTRMAQTTDHQGFVAWVQPFPFRSKAFDPTKHKFLIMIDSVQDPRNLGAIIRSAYCTGADGIIVCKRGGSPLTPAAIKASAGLVEYMELHQASSPSAAVAELKKAGYTLYLATLGGEDALKVQYKEPLCIIIGSEGTGISPEILNAGQKVMLPQKRADISYNASVAAGILLFLIANKVNKLT
jgi:23S rRNA (guanosine2251-2'-O)-methyltransferase